MITQIEIKDKAYKDIEKLISKEKAEEFKNIHKDTEIRNIHFIFDDNINDKEKTKAKDYKINLSKEELEEYRKNNIYIDSIALDIEPYVLDEDEIKNKKEKKDER